MTKWLQAIRQSTTYLGVAVIVIIWGGICLLAVQERESAYQDAVRQGGNLALVLEEYIRRVVQESDSCAAGAATGISARSAKFRSRGLGRPHPGRTII